MKARFLIPLGIFLALALLLGIGLTLNPRDVPSVLINEKAPTFNLPDLFDPEKRVSSQDMQGKVWLLNVWGVWCPECWREHEFLNHLAKDEGVTFIGIDWRDDREEAIAFLTNKGNPFAAVGFDPESEAIMDWGVYGAPETFVIDKQGMIRKKHTGPLYQQVWDKEFRPLLQQLEGES
ncbi:DsbE family thiol:disulfide interchange protein [Sedimenticola hydrogenitrophicus]|uniref:DsbE family thiol:disulfide interchange protein n=1 Tax=Sedimenticola hydrogenitrophicus TaxID=2967975 RepID=UPI0023B0119D|nr:DsbE family thiol:disulfide interchange protein [Sedimenticola hydrogenitrophicus]